jgi:hypothetical protein
VTLITLTGIQKSSPPNVAFVTGPLGPVTTQFSTTTQALAAGTIQFMSCSLTGTCTLISGPYPDHLTIDALGGTYQFPFPSTGGAFTNSGVATTSSIGSSAVPFNIGGTASHDIAKPGIDPDTSNYSLYMLTCSLVYEYIAAGGGGGGTTYAFTGTERPSPNDGQIHQFIGVTFATGYVPGVNINNALGSLQIVRHTCVKVRGFNRARVINGILFVYAADGTELASGATCAGVDIWRVGV